MPLPERFILMGFMSGWLAFLLLMLAMPAVAIPNAVFGPIAQSDSPLNGEDLTEPVLAALAGQGGLPGEWAPEAGVGAAEISHLLARPELFGREVVILRAVRHEGALERVEATFADELRENGVHRLLDLRLRRLTDLVFDTAATWGKYRAIESRRPSPNERH